MSHDDNSEKSEGSESHALVTVIVDGNTFHLRPGKWLVQQLKEATQVDPAKILAEITAHGLVDLEDSGHIEVHAGSKFMSHVRAGSAS